MISQYENNLKLVRDLLEIQHKYFKNYIKFSVLILVLGLTLICIGNIMTEGMVNTIINYGGGFVTSLSGFSLKELFSKKECINNYLLMKENIELQNDNELEQSKINDFLYQLLLKNK